ncbi:MAG: fibronectin type III domain-containing protein [Opitutaceae bacterium]|jgi:hypothetical protein|nr:fibronectin type III domain-containing protein [Opitutaceae bacterium]
MRTHIQDRRSKVEKTGVQRSGVRSHLRSIALWILAVVCGFPANGEAAAASAAAAGPAVIGDAALWLDASTLEPGPLAVWADRRANGHAGRAPADPVAARKNLPSVQSEKMPRVVETDDNGGRRVVRFSAASRQVLVFDDVMAGATEGEMFVVLRAASARPRANRGLMRWGGASTSLWPDKKGQLAENFGSAAARKPGAPPAPVAALAQWNVYHVAAGAGQWRAWFNGCEQAAFANNKVRFPKTPVLGQGSGSAFFDGDIAEVIIFRHVLTDTAREEIVEWLGRRHGLGGEGAPAAPAGLSGGTVSGTEVFLKWSGVVSPWVRHEIECARLEPAPGTVPTVKKTAPRTRGHLETGLTPAATYSWRVRAVSVSGEASAWSNPIYTRPASPPPLPRIRIRVAVAGVCGSHAFGPALVARR